MTNADKMRALVGAYRATDDQIKTWAYMNRVCLEELPDENPFACMSSSVDSYMNSISDELDENKRWDGFLKAEYVPLEVK